MDKKAKMLSELEELKMAEKDSSTPAEALDGIREAITNLQKKIDGYKERKPKAKAEPKGATKTATVKKPRGAGKPNPDFAKVQQIAKNLKAKDPSLKHTKAVSMAWAEVRGGAPAKTTKTAEKAPEKKAEPKKLDKLKVTAKPKETDKKAVVKKASEAPKKKNDLIEKVKRAKAKVKRVGKTYSYKQNGEVRTFQRDKKKDGLRTAKHVGRRVSKEGNVYYEYRDNRADVNIGKVSYKRPSLYAKGGILDAYDQKAFKEWMDDGNVIKNRDGSYSTQDANFRNRLESLTELKKYFKKEILEFAKGGMVDLFEDFEKMPKNVREIVERYQDEFGGDMDYKDTQNMLNELEAVGYTFDYYLDNEPYGLRPIGTPLSDLQGYEDEEYAKGGETIKKYNLFNMKKIWDSLSKNYEAREDILLLAEYWGGQFNHLVPSKWDDLREQLQKNIFKAYFGQSEKVKLKKIAESRRQHEYVIKNSPTARIRYKKQYSDGGEMDDENQRFDVNPNVTSTLANLQPYLDEYTMRKFGSKFPPETIFVEYYKRPDGTAQIEAVTLSNFTGRKSKRVTVDEIFETYARGGEMGKMYRMPEEKIVS